MDDVFIAFLQGKDSYKLASRTFMEFTRLKSYLHKHTSKIAFSTDADKHFGEDHLNLVR